MATTTILISVARRLRALLGGRRKQAKNLRLVKSDAVRFINTGNNTYFKLLNQ